MFWLFQRLNCSEIGLPTGARCAGERNCVREEGVHRAGRGSARTADAKLSVLWHSCSSAPLQPFGSKRMDSIGLLSVQLAVATWRCDRRSDMETPICCYGLAGAIEQLPSRVLRGPNHSTVALQSGSLG